MSLCFRSSLGQIPRRSIGIQTIRTYSSSLTPTDTVPLSFDHVPATGEGVKSDQSLVICHGLFGSKQNWRSLSKTLSKALKMQVFVLDLRNSGHSPHKAPHDYSHMAADVSHFLSSQNLRSGVNLMGHSMGGKVVMALALNEAYNTPLRTLISVDMAASRGKISPEFAQYAKAMMLIEKAGLKSKSEADKMLAETEPVLSVRQFLLTNSLIDPLTKTLKFRIPLDILDSSIPAIGDFPFAPGSVQWDGPTLALKGKKARYITERNEPVLKEFFPRARVVGLDTGHWVHAERPGEFVELVREFVEKKE